MAKGRKHTESPVCQGECGCQRMGAGRCWTCSYWANGSFGDENQRQEMSRMYRRIEEEQKEKANGKRN